MSRRPAFTLVELLVVTAIFAVLFAMVLAGGRPSMTGQVRLAAQGIATTLLAAQSRALGNPAGAGVIFEPVAGGGSAVTAVSAADMLPMITGQCTSGMPPASLAATTGTVSITPDNASAADLVHGYRIQFWERVPAQPVTPWLGFTNGTTVSFRAGQTIHNTIWPKPAPGAMFDVVIARYPGEGETLHDLPKNVAIDLRFSGVGDGTTFDPAWIDLSGRGAIALTFDSVGGVDAVMQRVLDAAAMRSVQPIHPTMPFYLLVAPQASVVSGTALNDDTALWIAVNPQTGRVSVSSNVAQSGTTSTDLRNARARARAQAVIGK